MPVIWQVRSGPGAMSQISTRLASKPRVPLATSVPAKIRSSPPEVGMRLQGTFNAGPLPETAEKFDLGPTYHDDLWEKKQTEVRNNEAVVQFILDQNLALLDALNPAPERDADFEISANNS